MNQKHLIYIATRPGVAKNEGCGFGLWGKLPGMTKIDTIEDLNAAYKTVGAASEEHTLYRAVLSVGKDTAQQYNLYDREGWERLLKSKIDVLRLGMDINKEDFCWAASMHYKKNHPHVHILYWDNGKRPRAEFVNKERFERVSEDIRRSLTAALENDKEIRALQNEESELTKETRLQLRAVLKEANFADTFNIDHIKAPTAEELGKELGDLAAELPRKGRLNYELVPASYKRKLDAFVDRVLQISDFAKLEKDYLRCAADVSRLYGNQDEMFARRTKEVQDNFRKALANEVLNHLKEVKKELRSQTETPEDENTLANEAAQLAKELLRERSDYKELLDKLPEWRTPLKVILKDKGTARLYDSLCKRIADDLRIRVKADALFNIKVDKKAATKDEMRDAAKNIHKAVYAAVSKTLWKILQEDKGYIQEQRQESAVMCLLRVFRSVSQEKNQMQARRELTRERYRNLSETAKRDLQKKREQEGAWSP